MFVFLRGKNKEKNDGFRQKKFFLTKSIREILIFSLSLFIPKLYIGFNPLWIIEIPA